MTKTPGGKKGSVDENPSSTPATHGAPKTPPSSKPFPFPAFAPGTCMECEAVVNFFANGRAMLNDNTAFAVALGLWHGEGHPGTVRP